MMDVDEGVNEGSVTLKCGIVECMFGNVLEYSRMLDRTWETSRVA